MARRIFEVAPSEDGWSVRERGADPTSRHPEQKDAVIEAWKLARAHQPSAMVVLNADGTIERQVRYGDTLRALDK